MQHARSRPYNPQANGQIERFNGTLERMIQARMLCDDTRVYVLHLSEIVATYNNLLHTGTSAVPAQVHTDKTTWAGAHTKIKTQAMSGKRRGRQISPPPLHPGDHVRVAILAKMLEKPATHWSRELYRHDG